MCIGFHGRIQPICHEVENQKVEIDDSSVKVNLKQEAKNVFQLVTHHDRERRLLGIELAKRALNMDCYDICHYLKKQIVFGHKDKFHGFTQILQIAELVMSGYEVYEATYQPKDIAYPIREMLTAQDSSMYTLELYQYTNTIKMVLDGRFRPFIDALIKKDYSLQNYMYRFIILNWDKDI